MDLNNVYFPIGSSGGTITPNYFSWMDNGILADNCTMIIRGVEMEQIDGAGIYHSNSSVRVSNSVFDEVETGIRALNPISPSSVRTSTFTSNDLGIAGSQGYITILENDFTDYVTRGVYLDGTDGQVYDNEFSISGSDPSTVGILRANLTTATLGEVENNIFNAAWNGTGVQLLNCNSLLIKDNIVNYTTGSTASSGSGILLSNSNDNDIRNNQIIGASSGTIPSFGIRTTTSTGNLYCCNTMDYLRSAMVFVGSCNSSKIKFNEFGNTVQSSFLCGPATLIGSQIHYKNSWTGTFSSPPPTVAHAKHDGTIPFVQSSIFEVNTCSAPLFPPSVLPLQSCPSTGDWFVFSSDPNNYECETDEDCAESEERGAEVMVINENDLRFLNGDYSEEEHSEMVEWQMGKDLYRKLLRDSSLINYNEDVANFYTNSQNTVLGQLVHIQETVSATNTIPQLTKISMDALVGQIDDLIADLELVESEMEDDISVEEKEILSNERIEILSEMEDLYSELHDLMIEFNSSVQTSYSSLLSLNNSMNTVSEIESMEKEVNGFYLQTLIDPAIVFDEEEIDYLFSVAELCHLDYGSVVFVARSLYLRQEYYHFDDDAICFPEPELKKSQDNVALNKDWKISIMPNPTSNMLNIAWKNNDIANQTFSLQLIDLQGKILTSRNESGDSGNIFIDVSNYSPGVYLIQGMDKRGIQFTEKVIISK